MSFDALSWAAKQNTGSSGSKLVLLGLAECAGRKDGRAFPSIAELVEFSSLNRKSVITNLDKLEAAGLISDSGERVGRTKQVKVYVLNLEAVPKTEPSQKRNSTVISAKGPKNGTRNKSEQPSEAKASSEPKRHLIPNGWQVPSAAELSPQARACAAQWTPASYATHAEAFVNYWRSERKMKADWPGTWANWVVRIHSQVMRDQKFGNAPPANDRSTPRRTIADIKRGIARAEDLNDFERAAELKRQLAALTQKPPDPHVAQLVRQATNSLRARA